MSGFETASRRWPDLPPPVVEARPVVRTIHGAELTDAYGWRRAEGWRDVLRDPAALPAPIRAMLEAENAYADAHLAPLADLRASLGA